jgi:hypothetical protein
VFGRVPMSLVVIIPRSRLVKVVQVQVNLNHTILSTAAKKIPESLASVELSYAFFFLLMSLRHSSAPAFSGQTLMIPTLIKPHR